MKSAFFRLVPIGSSTGGPALDTALPQLLADFPRRFVAQHLPASFTGPLPNDLTVNAISMSRGQSTNALKPGTIYIGKGDADVMVAPRGRRHRDAGAAKGSYLWHPSVERMVASAFDHLDASHCWRHDDGNATTAPRRWLRPYRWAYHRCGRVQRDVWGMPGELVRMVPKRYGCWKILPRQSLKW